MLCETEFKGGKSSLSDAVDDHGVPFTRFKHDPCLPVATKELLFLSELAGFRELFLSSRGSRSRLFQYL
jgi:hypothetical protein